jgi:hypothetical protein
MMVRMLFIAPAAGNYICYLRIYVADGLSAGFESAALTSGFIGDIDGPHAPGGAGQTLVATNQYVALTSPGVQMNVLDPYTPLAGATSFLVVGDLEVTSCYGNGNPTCPAGTYPATGTAQVYSRVVATPSSTAAGCTAQASTPIVTGVSYAVHHYRIANSVSVNLPSSGCGTWRIDIFTKPDSGGTLSYEAEAGPYSATYARPAL